MIFLSKDFFFEKFFQEYNQCVQNNLQIKPYKAVCKSLTAYDIRNVTSILLLHSGKIRLSDQSRRTHKLL